MSFLVADVGGTNARFAIASARSGVEPLQPVVLPTGAYSDMAGLVGAALRELEWDATRSAALEGACIAVAGPVRAGEAQLTNVGFAVAADELSGLLNAPTHVINDLVAVGYAAPAFQQRRQLGGAGAASGPQLLLAPGTGLGVSLRLPGEPVTVLPSEAGHAELAPGGPLDVELLQILSRSHAVVTWETAVSGPGLVHLYGAMCELWGAVPQEATPEWVVAQGQSAQDPVCHQTLQTFCGLIGSVAGNLVLSFAATGGVLCVGSLIAQLAEFAEASPLRRRFEERGAMSDFVREVPLHIVLDEQPGLLGAWSYLQAQAG